jgi:hypothetical protein
VLAITCKHAKSHSIEMGSCATARWVIVWIAPYVHNTIVLHSKLNSCTVCIVSLVWYNTLLYEFVCLWLYTDCLSYGEKSCPQDSIRSYNISLCIHTMSVFAGIFCSSHCTTTSTWLTCEDTIQGVCIFGYAPGFWSRIVLVLSKTLDPRLGGREVWWR